MLENFYRAFEDKYRGSRELILGRLKVYVPFIQPLQRLQSPPKAIDIGCGRGEWLQVVNGTGFDGYGVDIDDGMLAACHQLGLKVAKEDALSFLKKQQNESIAVVSGFHIAEHLPFEVLQEVIFEALRILIPGGLLILETPNPENIVVATKNFYLDPTHQRPIPPELLSFLAEHTGFGRVKVVRLQEDTRLKNRNDLNIMDILEGVSPDYSIVAQKNAPEETSQMFDSVFEADYGITLDYLNKALDKQAEAKAEAAEAKAEAAEAKAEVAENLARSILQSRSWKITAPLRVLGSRARQIKRGFTLLRTDRKIFVKKILIKVTNKVLRIKSIKYFIMLLLKPFPAIKRRLKRITEISPEVHKENKLEFIMKDSNNLSPRAKKIYEELKTAIEQFNMGEK